MSTPFFSILMLTYNAPEYVELAVRSVKERTTGVEHELVVVDNASDAPTRQLVQRLHREGLIDTLKLMPYNSLFAEGNKVASRLADRRATHHLLLNSDVEVTGADWLEHLLAVHRRGVTAYGVALDPLRVDGYCLLIDADLYAANPLDESHQWWWGVTKQQAALLTQGFTVQGYGEHERWVHHFGGRSGSAFEHARGMDVTREEVASWFAGHRATVLDRRRNGQIPNHETPSALQRVVARARRLVGRVRRRLVRARR
ncbi:glycosyltransferase family 2 protein [Kineococcus gynurae]|uniref:Glycosyltransferase family 2 protein n=1 Tax=Kineococcus gynurae TaxID=452979 RepID=A0ABV5LVW9_9ACTN